MLLQTLSADPAAAQTPPGPCEAGWVAPTPTTVPVTSMPMTVASTANDYFVLYRKFEHRNGVFIDLPVQVILGESGTTTVTENLSPLAADQYRLDKYQIANPADIDSDCYDDVFELNEFGVYNPVQRTLPVSAENGAVAIEDRARFEKLSFKGNKGNWTDNHLNDLEFIKFWIFVGDSEWPRLYFQDTQRNQAHNIFDRKMLELKGCCHNNRPLPWLWMRGVLVYHPNVVAPDGSQGMYRIEYQPYDSHGFRTIEMTYELIASAMPFLANNLAYYPGGGFPALKRYEKEKALYDASRVAILHTKDIMPDVEYIAYNETEGYGLLRELAPGESPGPRDVVMLRALPNDLPRAAGIISTVPQAPLAHVNLRAKQNGVPNAFIRDAFDDDDVTDLVGKHVRYRTTKSGFTLEAATKAEVDAHHAASRPATPQVPQRDLSVKTITALDSIEFDDWTAFGVKAANVAELSNLSSLAAGVAPDGFAVPFYFYDEFMKQATLGKETVLGKKSAPAAEKITLAAGTTLAEAVTAMLAHPHFQADYDTQEEMLDDLRKAIKKATTPAWIITALENMHNTFPAGQSLRYRSSTNNEDLPDFHGAGLYDSKTQDPDETADDGIDKSIKAVWASLWNFRAFLERDYHRVDHTATAMGVLVHPNYSDELANGVAVSIDPLTNAAGMHYVNTQLGEDLVTNPEVNSLPEQLLLDSAGSPTVLARSNLAQPDQLLMSDAQMVQLRQSLDAIHSHFATLYNVQAGDDFAMEIEFKITNADQLAIKQARPWVFPDTPLTAIWTPNPNIVAQVQAEIDYHVNDTGNRDAADRAKMVLAGINGDSGGYTSQQCRQVASRYGVSNTWKPWCDEIENLEIFLDNLDTSTSVKASVSITAGPSVIEGADAVFTVSANPVPSLPLTVSVDVSESGDFAASTGTQTVTIPANTATAILTVATVDDSADETAGSITVTVTADSAYTVAAAPADTATVVVADNDDPMPGMFVADAALVADVRVYAAETHLGTEHVDRWNRVLEGLCAEDFASLTAMTSTEAQTYADLGWTRWDPVVTELAKAEAAGGCDAAALSEVTIAADSPGVTEGAAAVFTLTANPAPASSLDVTVAVTQSGDFATTGAQTVTIPTGGSATLTIATTDDSVDEADGSVTATLSSGTGYTVSATQGAATINVADDDVPELTITASGGITEGGNATFTISASPAPYQALSVAVTVADSGDFASSGQSGSRTVAVPISGSVSFSVGTDDDVADEADGTITATLQAGSGYTLGSSSSATVNVSDNDDAPQQQQAYVAPAGLVSDVRGYAAETNRGALHVERWKRVLIGLGVESYAGLTAMTSTEAQTYAGYGWTRWDPVVTELGKAEAAATLPPPPPTPTPTPTPPPPPTPELTITGGAGVTEGADAVFTITASPAATTLTANLIVTQSGSYAASLPPAVNLSGGSATLRIGTLNDNVDEPDGSITVTLTGGSGYTVGSASSATIAVSDDDAPPPSDPTVSITGSAGIVEGGTVVFTITANPTPSSTLNVNLELTEQGSFVSTGTRVVQVPVTGTATLSVPTTDDSVDESDGSVTATLTGGSGYTVGSQGSATVSVADNDDPPPATPELTISGGAGVTEGQDAVFTITASPAATSSLTVNLSASQSGDFASSLPPSVTLTGGAATLRIGTVNDGVDEPNGSITVRLTGGSGYTVGSSSVATIAVADDDDPPPDTQDPAAKADLIARLTALRDEYQGKDFMVSWRAGETLTALQGGSSLASNPAIAPYHFRAAIASAYAVGDFDAAALFAEARDFLGVRVV